MSSSQSPSSALDASASPTSLGTTTLETIMALSLFGERSLAAASPANPLTAVARWIRKAQAARTRRAALSALLELDADRLGDLGISRQDVVAAMVAPAHAGRMLNTARARSARS
ncbi:MAG TPA: hypothetical protein VIL88_16250 [Devosia sp.]|jgi:uncharacterized protein YjiS (DUF1127 family)|uniref:hypothetical protein n=1 Tax=Devosia sp. TaxID=1871048 RepID=UPI002F937DC6